MGVKKLGAWLAVALWIVGAEGQIQISSFNDVQEALLNGHEVQVVIDLTDGGKNAVPSADGAKFDLFDATTVSLPLAPWNKLVLLDAAESWHFSRSFVTQDGYIGAYFVEITNFFGLSNVIVLEKVIDPVTFESLATADFFTQSVEYFDLTVESGVQTELTDFESIRESLMSGDGVVSVVTDISACIPNELPPPIDKYDVVVGLPAIDYFFFVYPDGSEEEQYVMFYASTISYDYGDFDLVYQRATNSYYIYTNGTVVVNAEALYGSDGPGVQGSFTTVCSLGEGVRVRKNVRHEPEVVTPDFASLKEALTNGRKLRVIIDERTCETPALPDERVTGGYDVPAWELFLDPQFGPEQFLGFSTHTFMQGGNFLLDETRVYESGRIEIRFSNIDTTTSTVWSSGVIGCDLGEDNYFITLDSPERELLTSVSRVQQEVLSGSTLQFVSPYQECRRGPGVEAIGGSPLKQIAVGAGIAADAHSLISNYFTDEGLAYNSVPLFIDSSGRAMFYPALYDGDNWSNLFPDGYSYECDLFDGTEGSVYVYKAL